MNKMDTDANMRNVLGPEAIKLDLKKTWALLKENYSAYLTLNKENGEVSFTLANQSGNLAPEALIALHRFSDSFIKLEGHVAKAVRDKNGLRYYGNIGLIPSEVFAGKFSEKTAARQENKGGNYGNISMSFATPLLPGMVETWVAKEMETNGLKKKLSGKAKDFKLLCEPQMKLAKEMEMNLLLEDKDGDNWIVKIPKDMSTDEIDTLMSKAWSEGATPLRLIFKGVGPKEQAMFNMSTVTVLHKKVQTQIGKKAVESKYGWDIEEQSSKEIYEKWGFNVAEALEGVSRNNFLIGKGKDGKPKRLFILETMLPYLPQLSSEERRPYTDNRSFVRSRVASGDIPREIMSKSGDRLPVEVVRLDEALSECGVAGWSSLRDAMPWEPTEIAVPDFLSRYMASNVEKAMAKLCSESLRVPMQEDDEQIVKALRELNDSKGDSCSRLFILNEYGDEENESKMVTVKNNSTANCDCMIWERGKFAAARNCKSDDDLWSGMPDFFSLFKKNLAFEREKALTVLFLEELMDRVDPDGSIPAKVFLEMPTKTTDGGLGYIDALISFQRESDGAWLSQAFEFKAGAAANAPAALEGMALQSEKYDLSKISKMDFKYGFDGGALKPVAGEVLSLQGLPETAQKWAEMLEKGLNQEMVQQKKMAA